MQLHTHEEGTMEHTERTYWDRIGLAGLIVMLAAILFAATSPLIASAGAEDSVTGNRDDDAAELVAVGDDYDDDNTNRDSNSGQPSIGSNSGNTGTGSTAGTGQSKSVSNSSDRSANTATGTTQGTGPSASVSNSS
jgi:hypothetical protein